MFLLGELFVDELLEGSSITRSVVFLARTVLLGEELDGGEAFDASLVSDVFVSSDIDFSDDDILTVEGFLGELFPGGLHADAVAAPGGEVLDEDVLVFVTDDGVVVGRSELDDFSGGDGGTEKDDESGEEDLHDLSFYFIYLCKMIIFRFEERTGFCF